MPVDMADLDPAWGPAADGVGDAGVTRSLSATDQQPQHEAECQ